MLSGGDLKTITLFETLPDAELDRIARLAADLHLGPGDTAANEGDEGALYAVISGKIDVVKKFDGVERLLGHRVPGQIFGEVPITLGTPFPGGYRATEPTRVMRLETRHYHGIAANAPEVATNLTALARERIGGLQGLTAEPPKVRAVVLGHQWDAACADLRRFLTRNQVRFEFVTPDAPGREKLWPDPLPTEDCYPALRLEDGSVLQKPSSRELAQALGLQTAARLPEYDTMIIGGGPAGLAAAVYGASEGLRTVVIEREAPGGQAGTSSRIENYLGFPSGVSGDELANRALQQAKRLGAEVLVTRQVTSIDPETREVTLDGGDVIRAKTIILATGVSWRKVAIEGADKLAGKGLYYGAARSEAASTHGVDVYLVGAGNSAGQAALYFSAHARTVTLVVRGADLAKSMSHYLIEQLRTKANIDVSLGTEVHAVHGKASIEEVDLRRADGTVERRPCGGLFVFIGADAETAWMPFAIARDERGYILTGDAVVKSGRWPSVGRDPYLLETSAPGIFACGDVRLAPVKRVAAAVGEGSMAIAFVHQFLAQQG
jgi:thioredoxin reductase (NADPH)